MTEPFKTVADVKGQAKRKTLAELFNEPCTIAIDRTLMHQGFQIPGGSTESSLSGHRPGTRGLELVYHPGYGLIGFLKGKYFLSPSANVIVAHEV
jgi:hypothetical protein